MFIIVSLCYLVAFAAVAFGLGCLYQLCVNAFKGRR